MENASIAQIFIYYMYILSNQPDCLSPSAPLSIAAAGFLTTFLTTFLAGTAVLCVPGAFTDVADPVPASFFTAGFTAGAEAAVFVSFISNVLTVPSGLVLFITLLTTFFCGSPVLPAETVFFAAVSCFWVFSWVAACCFTVSVLGFVSAAAFSSVFSADIKVFTGSFSSITIFLSLSRHLAGICVQVSVGT